MKRSIVGVPTLTTTESHGFFTYLAQNLPQRFGVLSLHFRDSPLESAYARFMDQFDRHLKPRLPGDTQIGWTEPKAVRHRTQEMAHMLRVGSTRVQETHDLIHFGLSYQLVVIRSVQPNWLDLEVLGTEWIDVNELLMDFYYDMNSTYRLSGGSIKRYDQTEYEKL